MHPVAVAGKRLGLGWGWGWLAAGAGAGKRLQASTSLLKCISHQNKANTRRNRLKPEVLKPEVLNVHTNSHNNRNNQSNCNARSLTPEVGGIRIQVAVKRLKPEVLKGSEDLKEFLMEGNLMRKLRHE